MANWLLDKLRYSQDSTVSKIGAGVGGFFKGIAYEYPQKAGIQIGLWAANKIKPTAPTQYTTKTKIGMAMLGKEPIKSVDITGYEMLKDIGFGEEKAKKYGLGTGLVFAGLDLLPVSSGKGTVGKNLVKQLFRANKASETKQILKLAGVVDDLIEPYAKKFARTTNIKTIETGLKQLNKIQTETFLKPTIKTSDRMLDIIKKVPERKLSRDILSIQKTAKKGAIAVRKSLDRKVRKLEIKTATKVAESKAFNIASTKLSKAVRGGELKLLKEGVKMRATKDKVIEKLIDKSVSIASKKKIVYEYTKMSLPPEVRGKLLPDVAKAETQGNLSAAFRKIIKIQNDIKKKEMVGGIEKAVKDIEKLPLKWQDKILEAMDKISLKGMSKETIKKLEDLKTFLSKEPEAKFLFRKPTLAQKVKIPLLEKQTISKMKLEDLTKLYTKVLQSSKEGKLASRLIEETKKLEIENLTKNIIEKSKNIDVEIPRTIGVNLSKKEKLVNSKLQLAKQMKSGYMNYVSSDIGFEILDNNVRRGINYKTFKEPFNDAFFNYKEMNSGIVDNYFLFKKEIEKKFGKKFTEANMERVMVYATKMQEGGKQKMVNSGVDKLLKKGTTIDNIKLNEQETKLYKFMRGIFDEIHPHIDNALQTTHGRKLGNVDNYFSWQTDFNNSDEVFKRLEGDYVLTSRTAQGFTKERTLAGRQVLKLNAEDVFLKHINDSTYFIHTEELLNDLGKIARTSDYSKAVGKNGQKWVAGWVDLMARKGVPEGYKPAYINLLLRNIGSGILGFRLSPVVKQPIAKITSSALLGKHTFKYDPEYFAKGLSKYVRKVSGQQKFRTFDDPAFTELAKNKKLAKWQESGYYFIKTVDQMTADNVWYASYRKYFADKKLVFNLDDFKTGKTNKEALHYADLITRRTQGSGEYKDLAKMLTSKDKNVAKAILQFQSFVLNESYLLPHDAIGKAWLKEKNVGKALGILTAYMTAGLAEGYISTGMAQLFSSKQYAEDEREKKFTARMFDAMITKIPFINNLYGAAKYDGVGVPLVDIYTSGVGGATSIISGKETETKVKGLTRLIEALSNLLIGIPGVGQAGQIIRKYGIDEKEKEASGKRIDVKKLTPRKLTPRKLKQRKLTPR